MKPWAMDDECNSIVVLKQEDQRDIPVTSSFSDLEMVAAKRKVSHLSLQEIISFS
jgi:hypothetical protein